MQVRTRLKLLSLLLLIGLMSGWTAQAQAADCSAAPYFGVIDGDVVAEPANIKIDINCRIQNFPASIGGMNTNFSFDNNDPTPYLVIFDNVFHTGQMSCNAPGGHKIWFTNGSSSSINAGCQDILVSVEKIDKQNPVGLTSATIGVPFIYTMTIPVLYNPGDGTIIQTTSVNDLSNITVTDNLNRIETGADLTLVGDITYTFDGGPPIVATNLGDNKNLNFVLPDIPAGSLVEVSMMVVLDDTPANTAGTVFQNTAKWEFDRLIDGTPFTNLPGEWGVTEPMSIAEPDLVMDKSSTETAINLATNVPYVLDAQNIGGATAWGITIEDELPVGMCGTDPLTLPGFSVALADAGGGTLITLVEPTHYTATYAGCLLTIDLVDAIPVQPTQRIIVNYEAQLDGGVVTNGLALTNVAAVTQWTSANPATIYPFRTYNRSRTDGTDGIVDHEDFYTIITALSGYYFQKTVANVTTGIDPATTAVPGDQLLYTLRLYNVDQTVNNVTISDILDPTLFDTSVGTSFIPVLPLAPGADYSFDPGTGTLNVFGAFGFPLNLPLGNEIVIQFYINLASPLPNNTTVPNQATLVFDNPAFPATSPNPTITVLSDDPNVNGIAPPPSDPPDPMDPVPDPTNILIQTPGALLKENPAGQTSATIGELITYTITVPENTVSTPLYDVRITDDLSTAGADLEFVSANVVSGGSWALTNSGTPTAIILEDTATGIDIPANGQAVIEITVQMLNTLPNQNTGVTFSNTANYTYNRINGGGLLTNGQSSTTPPMALVEPAVVTMTKTASNTAPLPGETITYTVELTAQAGAAYSNVFDVILTDTLDLGLVYVGSPTVTGGGVLAGTNTINAPEIVGDGIAIPQTLEWSLNSTIPSNLDIEAGTTITIQYDVMVLSSVLPNQALNNSIVAQWSSLDGGAGGERNGADGIGGLNDYYIGPVLETVTTPNLVATIDKVRTTDTYGALDSDVRIGDIVDYTLTISMPEGTLGSMEIIDTLPQGLQFEEVVSINGNVGPAPYSAVAPFSHPDIAAPVVAGDPTTGPSTVTWTIGTLNNAIVDATPNDFVIVYRARVLNLVIPHANLDTSLNNTVDLNYETGLGTQTQSDTDTIITARQPLLAITKSAAPAGGDDTIDANELIDYTVAITNNGTAPAYDLLLRDVIPVGLRNGALTVQTQSVDLLNDGQPALPNVAPTYNAGTGLAEWDFDTGGADAYTIPVGDTLVLVYRVQADAALSAGLTMTNQAEIWRYYSFDNQAEPQVGAVTGVREIYGPEPVTASTTLYSGSPPTKALVSPLPASPEVVIGEVVEYTITVPGVAGSSTLYDVQVTDVLDAHLEYVSASVSGVAGAVNNSIATQMDITIPQIPATQQAVITLRARVRNVATAQENVAIANTAAYTFAYSMGGATQPALTSSENVTVTIIEPVVGLAKGVANVTSPGQPPTAGDVLRYTLSLTASGGVAADQFSDAFDVTIEDSLSLGLVYTNALASPSVSGAGNTILDPIVAGDGVALAQTLTWSLAAANADIDVTEGTVVTITYDVLVLDGVIAGQVLTNSAVARWTSLDGADASERDGSAAPAHNDYYTVPATTMVTVPDTTAIAKNVIAETFGALDSTVRIGDIIDYELLVTLPEGFTQAVAISDTLPQGLQFEGVVSINGDTAAPYAAVPPFTHADIAVPVVTGNPAVGPSTVDWTIGDVTNAGDNNPANDGFRIVYRTRVLNNNALAQVNSTLLTNNVTLNYTTAGGPAMQATSTMLTVVQPNLGITKVAAPAGGDSVIVANEVIDYTVEITNNGLAPAYDLVLRDVIPVGLRNGAVPAVQTISVDLVNDGQPPLPNVVPNFDPGTGLAEWDFNTGGVNTYTIPPGDTLILVYRVQADASLSPDMILTNSAQVWRYYSLDDGALPNVGSVTGDAQIYGPHLPVSNTLTTAAAINLGKQNPATTSVQIGDTFTWRITVPANPMPTALHDVRILDNLGASAADLELVSITKVPDLLPWTPTNTSGSLTNLVIEDITNGIDIPAGEQIAVDITVVVLDTANNDPVRIFNNTATYTYNRINEDNTTLVTTGDVVTPDMQIVGPDNLVMTKGGPMQMNPGTPEIYTLDLHNQGSGRAWDVTIIDILPNPDPGGMCDTPPANITAQLYLGAATVGGVLVQGMDYTANWAVAPACTLTLTMMSTAASIPADHRLIITYEALLDPDNPQGTNLTNLAGATQWFSGDTAGAGATGQIRTYTRTLTTGTEGTPDHEDIHTTITQSPVIRFQKTVINQSTAQDPGVTASPGDILHYTISATNISSVPLTNFAITDELDDLNASPWFAPGSLRNIVITGGGTDNSNANGGASNTGLVDVSFTGLDAMGGANDSATIEFDIDLAGIIPNGTVVLNQAQLDSIVTGTLVSDDPNTNGIDDPAIPGGEDPTPITITSAPVLDVQKISTDITGDPNSLSASDILRYTITVKNIGGEDSINTTLQDTIPLNTTYVPDTTFLNGVAVPDPVAGVSALAGGMPINAPEDLTPGNMRADPNPAANNTATITFEVMVVPTAAAGTVISNQGFVDGDGVNGGVMPTEPSDDPATPADDDPTIDTVDVSGVGALSGYAWHDANFDNVQDAGERVLAGWFVDVYLNGAVLTTASTDATGFWEVTGLAPNNITADTYEVRFRAPGAGPNTALLGLADSPAVYGFTNDLQRISAIVFGPGTSTPDLNLPIDPDGVVYGSVTRTPVAGSALTMIRTATGLPLPDNCFLDANQQGQVTLADGYYKFDIDFNAACPAGENYIINVGLPATGYTTVPSVLIPPVTDAGTGAYSVPTCAADAIGGTPECEAQGSEFAPAQAVAPGPGTNYYLHLTLNNGTVPQDSQLFNNHIPIDQDLANAVNITKAASLVSVNRGQLIPYTITVTNTLTGALPDADIIDNFPAGFHYVKNSARLDGVKAEPVIVDRTLTWPSLTLNAGTRHVIKLLLVVGSGVGDGKYINRAHVWDNITSQQASPVATATVRVVPDPTFDCTDIIGKVFDDKNMNGYQDDGEQGIASARVVSARGLIMKTDEYGRFHLTCAVVPNPDRGSNFILKLDERSLPSGYRVITENPRVQRATRGKMMKFNFGATIHRVIRLDVADPVFEPGTDEIRLQWKPRLDLLVNELGKGAAILRISYLGDTESSGLVDDRIDVIKEEIEKLIEKENCCAALTIETEIFWRRGGPPGRGGID